MAEKRIIDLAETTQFSSTDYLVVDSETNGTKKMPTSLITNAIGAPFKASTVAEMTDTSRVYVYTGSESGYTSGNWYYYNGSSWVSGGVYNATAVVTDSTLTQAGEPADAKATGDEIADLKSDINEHSSIITANLMGIDVQQNLYEGAADWSGTWTASNPSSLSLANETFDGYPVMYYSAGWRKYLKSIPIEAGKTYTFEAWIKPVSTGAVFAYLKDNDTTNPATISSSMLQINGATANQWLKLSKTFTCSASGNITPYVYSGAGAFYFTKYVLVEGDAVFSLSDDLNNKATKQEVSALGDYEKYDFSLGTSLGKWWNITWDKTISKGTRVRLMFDSYSGASSLEYEALS